MSPRFELFGAAHLAALGAIALGAAGMARLARASGWERTARALVAAGLIGAVLAYVGVGLARGTLNPWHLLPLHLCDMAILLALFALVTRRPWASELLMFWALTGTVLASVTPDLRVGFPSARFLTYFALHGGVIVAAAVLTFGAGLRPRPGAVRRALILTNLYALGVLAVNLATGENYLFLLEKPAGATLLDHMGPWPVYILVAQGVALVAFGALYRLTSRAWCR